MNKFYKVVDFCLVNANLIKVVVFVVAVLVLNEPPIKD